MPKGVKTGGRQKGTPNKFGLTLREDILDAYYNVGGVAWLESLAHDDKRTFASLLARILPTEIHADIQASGTITFKTMYENEPEALPAPSPDLTAEIIDAEIVQVTNGSGGSP